MSVLAMLAGTAGWLADADRLLVRASIPAWCICIFCLSPAVVRLLLLRGRYLDPIWALVLLLAINRLSFLLHAPLAFSHGTAFVMALLMAGFTCWYQRRDTARAA